MESAVYGLEQTEYVPGGTSDLFINSDILEDLTGVSVVHNTLMYPAKSVAPTITIFGIRITNFQSPLPGGAVKNNLIIGTPTPLQILTDGVTCNDNQTLNVGWNTIRDHYLTSFGPYQVQEDELDAPYLAAMQQYFTAAATSEEDNVFRSPTDFYPIHPDLLNNATDECAGACAPEDDDDPDSDYFGTIRQIEGDCANDYGAVELTFPPFTITENCSPPSFTIHPMDQGGTFTWTFGDQNSGLVNPTFFYHEGVGTYSLNYTYDPDDTNNACATASAGTFTIELTCSCPCESDGAINISAGAGTSWQQFTDITNNLDANNTLDLGNRCLSINGRLLIDDDDGKAIDLHLENGFTQVQPGSEIVVLNGGGLQIGNINPVEPGSELQTGIRGCDSMWEGIDVEEGGQIIVKNSAIQDAKTAIGITGSAEVEISNNYFENNYRGIDIAPVFNPQGNELNAFSLTVQPNGLSGNVFRTVGDRLKGTVDGSIQPGTIGEVGFKSAFLDLYFIPGDFANTFENLRHGVYANRSFLVVKGSTFRNVEYGARIFYSDAVFLDNRFESVVRGIEAPNPGGLWAANNIMENVEERGINCEGAANWGNYRLYGNVIAAPDYCINLEASTATTYFDIGNNNLTLTVPDAEEEFYSRAALRVFNIGAPVIRNTAEGPVVEYELTLARISNHAPSPAAEQIPITIHGYGDGIVLENMTSFEVHDNEVVYQNPSDETMYSYGIRLDDSAENYLEGNSVQVADADNIPNVKNIYLSGSPLNELSCNSTDGGAIGLGFYGVCNDTELKTTIFGSHTVGLDCADGSIIGIQNHRGNTWLPAGNYDNAAEHRGTDVDVERSRFQVREFLGSDEWEERFWPTSIYTLPTVDIEWFEPSDVSSVACEEDGSPGPGPGPWPPPIDRLVAEGGYITGQYATVHKWETEKRLFARLDKDESLRNSEVWFQNFYAQADTEAIGDYVKVQEQFKTLLSLSDVEHQQAEDLQGSIQDGLETLSQIEESYSQATSEIDRTTLEADWLEQAAQLNGHFTEWQQLAIDVRQRTQDNIATLLANNAALPEDILPAANEKLMNTIQLKRIAGEPISEEERHQVATLAFSCPLEAGNAVYRARSVLRTWGNYVFDDTANCKARKEDDDKSDGDGSNNKVSDTDAGRTASEWHIYPNPTQHRLWIAGNQMEELESVQLLNSLGYSVFYQQNGEDTRLELQLPIALPAGIYFLRLQLRSGEMYTQKILLQL